MKSNMYALVAAELFMVVVVVAGLIFWWNSEETNHPSPSAEKTLERFTEEFSQAFTTTDFETMKKMFYWEGVDDFTNEVVQESWKSDLRHRLVKVEFLNLEPDQTTEYEIEGVLYRPNLTPIGQLKIHYLDVDTNEQGWTSCMLGKHEGQFFVTLAAPAKIKGVRPL